MENFDWLKKYYSEDQLKKLATRESSPEEQLANQQAWENLISDIKAALDKDPASPEAQELAARWTKLINKFTQGDPELLNSLKEMYSHVEEIPDEIRPFGPEVQTFIQKALAAAKQN